MVFFEAENYLFFLRRMRETLLPLVSVIAYCLMPTHYHLLVRVRETPKSPAPCSACSSPTPKPINKRFDRVGALFQSAFQAKPVTSYAHLLTLCAYIHANPVKNGLTRQPEDWLYSNYLEWLGQRKGTLVDREFIREHFEPPEAYRAFMADYLATRRLPEEVAKYLQTLEE
ncbi:MAG: transposase [Anaerolineales bacterium]